MRKAELHTELALWDEDGTLMTCEMLRARLRQIYKAMPVGGAPARHKKKAELVEDAIATGCVLTGKETRGDLQILITEKHEQSLVMVKCSDPMPFGRHRTLSIQDMMNKLELPQPRVKGEKLEKTEGPWLLVKDQPRQRSTVKRSMAEETAAVDLGKSKEEQIIDLLGDMKMAMNALTTRVQKRPAWAGRAGPLRNLTDSQATWLAGCLDESATPAWTFLTGAARVKLMEVCCSPASGLSQFVTQESGADSAGRISGWNGFDLSTTAGLQKARAERERVRPEHMWFSLPCGPWSGNNNFNRHKPEVWEQILSNRKKSKRLIRNCLILVMEQVADRGHVHWERPKDLQPYRWPELKQVFKECDMRPPWEIWTTSDCLCQRMAIRCDGRHEHSPCVGGARTAATAYYPDGFVRRAAKAMLDEPKMEDICNLAHELGTADEEADTVYAVSASKTGLDSDELRKVEIAARRIHAVCGHCPFVQVARSLAARGADKRVVDHVREMRCPACDESQKHGPPRPVGAVDEVPKKWAILQSDLAEWGDPGSHEKYKLALYLDQGSKLGVGHVLFRLVKSKNATVEELKDSLWGRWIAYFGRPRTFQVDPEGAWMSNIIRESLEPSGIQMDPIPGQAHWQLGGIERLISLIKDMMTVLARERPGRSCEEYLARAMAAYNEFDRHRGFSPLQVALGRAPDRDGFFMDAPGDPVNFTALESEAVDAAFGENFKFMRQAQEAMLRWVYAERASHARSRKLKVYTAGTVVYYFRNPKSCSMTGRFYGPARVLATETVHRDGKVQPRPRVWLNACGRLIRCDPCQLRDASDREVAEHEIIHGTEMPWIFNSMSQGLRAGQYEDLADDPRLIPSDTEFVDAGDVPPLPTMSPAPDEPRRRQAVTDGASHLIQAAASWVIGSEFISFGPSERGERPNKQKRHDQTEEQDLTAEVQPFECFWNREGRAIEVEIGFPEGARGGVAARDLQVFAATQLRRQRAEVRERTLSVVDLEKFRKAKTKEAQEWIKEMVLEGLPSHVTAPSDRLMRLRWALTWKIDPVEPGGRRAKARLVILGFQDPDLTTEESHAPTATRTARQVFLQKAANLTMRVAKGDVKSAFLQGEELDQDLLVKPTGEIAEMLGLRSGQAAILKKSACGLAQAPRAWHQAVNRKLKELGWRQLESDPCVWILTGPQTAGGSDYIVAIVLSHVDDFLFAGRGADEIWQQARRQVMEAFRWTEWEYDTFTQCGVDITQRSDFGFTLSQATYTEQSEEIEVPIERRRQFSAQMTNAEKSQFRAATGSLQWKGTQTGPDILAELSLLQSKTESCTVDDLLNVNKLIKRAKETKNRVLEIFPFVDSELAVVGWGDAAFSNRVDGKSTEGRIVGIVPLCFLSGEETGVSQISWRSGKVERTCRSPPAAEVSATNLYDRLRCPEMFMGGKEFQTGLELFALRDGILACECPVRWVHSDAMIANSLTKGHERWQLELFFSNKCRWRLVHDQTVESAKKRKGLGVQAPENVTCLDFRPDLWGDVADPLSSACVIEKVPEVHLVETIIENDRWPSVEKERAL
ncbi:unnamed protein product [Prorocentrum cordatum]|uniref:Integrase catalytic domain-containing protein n=1 Tax=Prorocentrum cordatum TaxID=2364126 RepID=A0ABN9VG46_9DINO|nr:unnamed protein product [Polarella glacialis]